PAAPLTPGEYQLFLAGDPLAGGPFLAAPDGMPVGSDTVLWFRVGGTEGTPGLVVGGNETPTTATELTGATSGNVVRVVGAIGDDPSDPVPFDPNDVDMYHFRVDGPYAFAAEVFAGRVGSSLDPALTLFKDVGGHPVYVTGNGDTGDDYTPDPLNL